MKNGLYETSDFYLACYLRVKGLKIAEIKRDGRRVIFVFADQPERKDLIRQYYNGEGFVNPLDYQDAIKNLKSLMYNY